MRLSFTVPGTPPSVNTYVRHSRGRHFLTKRAQQFKNHLTEIVAYGLPLGWESWNDQIFSLEISCYFKSRKAPDIDNLPKICADSLQAAGVFKNDNQVDVLRVSRHFGVAEPRTEITVEALTEA